MSWGQDVRMRLQAGLVVMGIICPAILLGLGPRAKRQYDSSDWPKVPGIVLGTWAKQSTDNEGKLLFYGRVRYRYSVDGKDYESDLTDLGSGTKHSDSRPALEDVANYHEGDKVDVYYDPKDPGIGVLTKGISPQFLYLIVGLMIGTVIGVGALICLALEAVAYFRAARKNAAQQAESAGSMEPLGPEWSEGELGNEREQFHPKWLNVGAGVILGVGFLVGGIALAVYFEKRVDPKPLTTKMDVFLKHAVTALFGIGGPVAGVSLLVWMMRLAGHRVTVFERGFTHHYRGHTEVVPWKYVAKIREVFTEEELKVLKVPGASIHKTDRSFVVRRKDGEEFFFTVNTVDSIPRLAALFQEAAKEHGIPWEQVQQ